MIVTPPEVVLKKVTHDPEHIKVLVDLSRAVAKWNRNTTWKRKLTLITDDLDLANSRLGKRDKPLELTSSTIYYGMTWVYSGIIWIEPDRIESWQPTKTLVHEMAHVLVPHVMHGFTWRRMYSILLPLWWVALFPNEPLNYSYEIFKVVEDYSHYRDVVYVKRFAKMEAEADRHEKAMARAYDRWVTTFATSHQHIHSTLDIMATAPSSSGGE